MRSAVAIVAILFSTVALADDAKEISTLQKVLKSLGFTGKVEETVPKMMGRPLDANRVELGRLVFFDKGLGLHRDNSCAGCHSPTKSMGDTQPLAIGIQAGLDSTTKQEIVGPSRTGPRNQRRTPTVVNVGMLPVLMWNGRFHSPSGSAFDNKAGFVFPVPEGDTFFVRISEHRDRPFRHRDRRIRERDRSFR
jgi:cytochrome c peroxidase